MNKNMLLRGTRWAMNKTWLLRLCSWFFCPVIWGFYRTFFGSLVNSIMENQKGFFFASQIRDFQQTSLLIKHIGPKSSKHLLRRYFKYVWRVQIHLHPVFARTNIVLDQIFGQTTKPAWAFWQQFVFFIFPIFVAKTNKKQRSLGVFS